ncbi:MAG: hypothetical protein AB9915_03730 [Candidatus Dojkabacteria bacterium]
MAPFFSDLVEQAEDFDTKLDGKRKDLRKLKKKRNELTYSLKAFLLAIPERLREYYSVSYLLEGQSNLFFYRINSMGESTAFTALIVAKLSDFPESCRDIVSEIDNLKESPQLESVCNDFLDHQNFSREDRIELIKCGENKCLVPCRILPQNYEECRDIENGISFLEKMVD